MFSFHSSFSRFSLSRLAAFYTTLVTLRGGLDCPSCATGTGTCLPRRQSQQVHLGRSNHLDIVNLLSPWWRPGLHSLFQDLQRLRKKELFRVTCGSPCSLDRWVLISTKRNLIDVIIILFQRVKV